MKVGVGGKPIQNEEEVSRFRILRRAIRQIGISNEPIRIFTLFTDTTSKISNFQPSIAPHSFRKALRAERGNDIFPPIVIVPTFDYHVNYRLQITDDPLEVARPKKLFSFERTAWLSMLESGTPYEKLVALAEAKLTRRDPDSLRKLFQSDPLEEESRLVMLVLMGTRLALQTGSFTALLPEMVSSHLMVLMRVSDDRKQLEAFYPERADPGQRIRKHNLKVLGGQGLARQWSLCSDMVWSKKVSEGNSSPKLSAVLPLKTLAMS